MNALLTRLPQKTGRKPCHQARLDVRPQACHPSRHAENIQLIYTHLPPAVILAVREHLRAQTQIEQRARQLWLARGCCQGRALDDWLRAEREVIHNLCEALLCRNARETAPPSTLS